tara:strand:+ start:2490 stop:3470 length:981 start_codon:yes stop_codon:yes gene_type:complete
VPLFSIITPSWNRVKSLPKLIASLESQTFKDFEWVLGNDGSTDGTKEFVESIKDKLPFKLTFINFSLRGGKAKLDNELLNHAKGNFLIWCDSDDYLKDDALEFFSNTIAHIKENTKFDAILAQNLDTNGISQTFYNQNVDLNNEILAWEQFSDQLKGDGTICINSKCFENMRFLEVDFLITESSLLQKVFKDKNFYVSKKVVKVMDRTQENSVSFGKKLQYCRGSAYAIAETTPKNKFSTFTLKKRMNILLNFWRYSFHGDISLKDSMQLWDLARSKMSFALMPVSLLLCLRDLILDKVDKTHLEFNNNLEKIVITIKHFDQNDSK